MGDILNQLEQLFLQSIPTVIFVFFLLVILDWLFFRPLTRVLREREEATVGALARAREQSAAAEDKAREYEAAFQAARQEVYRQREAERKAALLGSKPPLTVPPRLRRIGRDHLDPQLLQRPPHLRQAARIHRPARGVSKKGLARSR